MPIQNWSDEITLAELHDDPACTDDLNTLIDMLGTRDAVDLVIDFANVSYLNSSNIAKLLKLRKLVVINAHRKMVLSAINSHVWGVFLITGLDRLFEFTDSVAMGLASVQIDADNQS